jgi:copper(I)-binding protein
MPPALKRFAALALVFAASHAIAQVQVDHPWVQATVPAQRATGAFMTLTATEPLRLVDARSPLAGNVEVHEMAMEGGVMKMRALPVLELPAGRAVELKPGAYHVMLFDLKRQIKAGDKVPLTLVVVGKDGKRRSVEVTAQARALGVAH